MRLKKIRIGGWRSLRDLELRLGPVTLIIGPNNCGKSNVARLLARLRDAGNLGPEQPWISQAFGRAAIPRGLEAPGEVEFEFEWQDGDPPLRRNSAMTPMSLRLVPLRWRDDTFDVLVSPVEPDGTTFLRWADERNLTTPDGKPWRTKETTGAGKVVHTLRLFEQMQQSVLIVDALRDWRRSRVSDTGVPLHNDGGSVFAELHGLKRRGRQGSWEDQVPRLERWLQRIMGEHELPRLDIDASLSPHVRLLRGGREMHMDLADLGAGVAQALILLAYCVLHPEPRLVILEEPESNLHPAAATELIRIIAREFPQHQVLVTTHSAGLLDASEPDWRTYAMTLGADGITRCRVLPATARDRGLMRALGLRPSQVFMANTIIWVEGPSDVLVYRRLLRDVARAEGAAVLEGRDYAFCHYGGSNLAHLGIDDEATVDLSPISPFPVIIRDKDNRKATKHARELATALRTAFSAERMLVTPHRTLENLIQPRVLQRAALAACPRIGGQEVREWVGSWGPKEHPLTILRAILAGDAAAREPGKKLLRSKAQIAEHVAQQDDAFTPEALEFGTKILGLVRADAGRL